MEKTIIAKTKNLDREEVLHFYVHLLKKQNQEFSEICAQYDAHCENLKAEFDGADRITELFEQLAASGLMFTFKLGMRANAEHFYNPTAPTFLDGDYDACLQESNMRKTPEYVEAYTELCNLADTMPRKAHTIYEKMLEYFALLETYIPKLAHYLGFKMGNSAFLGELDGYTADTAMTDAYTKWINSYLEIKQ